MIDLIDRQAVIDLLKQMRKDGDMVPWEGKDVFARIRKLPTIQPEPSILLSWVEEYIEWLRSLDNEFANLAAAHISVMVKKWRDEQDERTD